VHAWREEKKTGEINQQSFSRDRSYLRFRVIDVVDLMRHLTASNKAVSHPPLLA